MSEKQARVWSAGGPRPGRRSDAVALIFIGVALLLVLVVPLLTDRRTGELRERLEDVAEPARDATTAAQYQLAREMSNLRAYLLTGDTLFLNRYEDIALRQELTLAELGALAERLGPETAAQVRTLRDHVLSWQEGVTEEDLARPEVRTRGAVLLDQARYEQASGAAATLDHSVSHITRQLRQDIRAVERVGFLLTLTLAALAVIAAGVLVRFGRRLRTLAAEADERHREARRALEATRAALEARDRLARGVTHDVKNPLGAADGYAEILQLGLKGPLAPEQAATVEGIRRSLRSALSIIDDLLDLARAERGQLPLTVRRVALNDVVAAAAEAHRGAMEAAGQSLELSVPPAPLVALTDPRRVEQILGNLLSNAAKYGGGGVVRLSLEWEGGSAGGRDWASIGVRDSGAGIPPDQLESIFIEFHRIHQGDRRGHGVGLAISRHIARQLGGELSVRNDAVAGAAFILRLPLEPRADPLPADLEAIR